MAAKPNDPKFCPVEADGPDEPLIIQAQASRVVVAITCTIVALIWNSVTFFVAFSAWKANELGGLSCLSIFIIIGLCIAGFAVYSTLQIFNPMPVIVFSQRNIYPGSEFEVSWLVKGKVSSIKRLSVVLEGFEKATYKQGTNTRSETSVFVRLPVLETADTTEIASGFRLIQLPADTMHSFESARNQIGWRVEVRGVIPRWPDIFEHFPFVVLTPPPDTVEHA